MAGEQSEPSVPAIDRDEEQGEAAGVRSGVAESGQTWKERAYLLTEDPSSSWEATIVSVFILLCIVGSTSAFILQTIPALEHLKLWFYLEVFFVSVFTIEYAVRFWATPLPKWKFVIEPFNMVDLLAIAPFYIELLLPGGALDLRVLRALRLLRLFRLFKVGKYSTNTQLIAIALSRSVQALVLMLFFVGMAMIFFATIFWMVDTSVWDDNLGCQVRPGESVCSPLKSIPHTFYWAITTMTTVGYGDVLPKTNLAKLVAGLTMVCGIVVIALPITMIGNTFVDTHNEIHEEAKIKRVETEITQDPESAQELFRCTKEFGDLRAECETILSTMKQLLASEMLVSSMKDDAASALAELRPSFDILMASHLQSMDDLNDYAKTSMPGRYR